MRNQREVQGLGVHGEAVGAEADRAAVVGVQVCAVAQRAQGLLAGGPEAAVEFLRPYLVAEFTQFADHTADPFRHRVGREVGGDGVPVGQGAGAAGHRPQHAGGGVGEAFGAAGAGVGEGLLAGGERLVDLVAFVGERAEEVVGLGEAELQVLHLDEHAGELLLARLGAVRGGERAGDRLPDQGELGCELGTPLAVEEFATAAV